MNGKDRRQEILSRIVNAKKPVSGTLLAGECQVSRQVIVQDIAILRAEGHQIISTNRGYICMNERKAERVFWVNHTEEQMEEEMNVMVDCGGMILDVFVRHEIYGEIRAELNLSSRRQIREFMSDITSGKSQPLMNITSGFHFHTVAADSEEILDQIGQELKNRKILVKLEESN